MTVTLVNDLAHKHGDRVMAALRAAEDGKTDFELANELNILLSSINAARNTLMNQGYVKARGDRRPSGRGGMAKVWVAA